MGLVLATAASILDVLALATIVLTTERTLGNPWRKIFTALYLSSTTIAQSSLEDKGSEGDLKSDLGLYNCYD